MSNIAGISITDSDKGGGVDLATWIPLAVACLAVLTKVASKFRMQSSVRTLNMQADDWLLLSALASACGESVAVSKQVSAGSGQHEANLSVSHVEAFQKAGYSSQILYVLTIGLAQLATLSFIMTLALKRIDRISTIVVAFCATSWTIVSMLGAAFQCQLPASWATLSGKCFNQPAFWTAVGVLSLLVDLILIVLPTSIITNLQLPWSKKLTVVGAFAIRVVNGPAVILRIFYIWQAAASTDPTYYDWRVAVVTQVGMNVAIIVACLIFMKPVIDQLQPGWSASNLRTGLGYNTIVGKSHRDTSGYVLGSVIKSKNPGTTGAKGSLPTLTGHPGSQNLAEVFVAPKQPRTKGASSGAEERGYTVESRSEQRS